VPPPLAPPLSPAATCISPSPVAQSWGCRSPTAPAAPPPQPTRLATPLSLPPRLLRPPLQRLVARSDGAGPNPCGSLEAGRSRSTTHQHWPPRPPTRYSTRTSPPLPGARSRTRAREGGVCGPPSDPGSKAEEGVSEGLAGAGSSRHRSSSRRIGPP
jgi:hypothetical protein